MTVAFASKYSPGLKIFSTTAVSGANGEAVSTKQPCSPTCRTFAGMVAFGAASGATSASASNGNRSPRRSSLIQENLACGLPAGVETKATRVRKMTHVRDYTFSGTTYGARY